MLSSKTRCEVLLFSVLHHQFQREAEAVKVLKQRAASQCNGLLHTDTTLSKTGQAFRWRVINVLLKELEPAFYINGIGSRVSLLTLHTLA